MNGPARLTAWASPCRQLRCSVDAEGAGIANVLKIGLKIEAIVYAKSVSGFQGLSRVRNERECY
jgi:hypothetical protein